MSTYLQLCVHARRECRIAGTGPAAVTGQVGELARLVNWASQAYVEIQNKHPYWKFLRSSFTVQTVADDDTYAYGDCTDSIASAVIDRFASWKLDEFQLYLTSSGAGSEIRLPHREWDAFRRSYRIGTQTSSMPAVISVNPQESLVLGPKPNGIYTLTGDYYKGPQILAANGDTPEMPSRFHYLIVYETVRRYAAEVGAPDLWDRVKDDAADMWAKLRQSQLPPSNYAEPLA